MAEPIPRGPRPPVLGDRFGALQNLCGREWGLAAHGEDLGLEETSRRAEATFAPVPRPQ